jgi:hypothetical protein
VRERYLNRNTFDGASDRLAYAALFYVKDTGHLLPVETFGVLLVDLARAFPKLSRDCRARFRYVTEQHLFWLDQNPRLTAPERTELWELFSRDLASVDADNEWPYRPEEVP